MGFHCNFAELTSAARLLNVTVERVKVLSDAIRIVDMKVATDLSGRGQGGVSMCTILAQV